MLRDEVTQRDPIPNRECRMIIRPESFVARRAGDQEAPMVCVLWLAKAEVALMAFAEPKVQDVALLIKQIVDNSARHISDLKACGAWSKANAYFDLKSRNAPDFKDDVAWKTATVVSAHVAMMPNTADIRVEMVSNPGIPIQGEPQQLLIRLDELLCSRFVEAILGAADILPAVAKLN